MENGTTEPEDDDPDEESDTVELLDEVQVAYGVGTTNDIAASQPENPNPEFDTGTGQFTTQTTLREFLKSLSSDQGIQLEGDIPAENGGGTGRNCFSGTTDHYLSVFWWLPINHGNQVQSDSVEFDLGFYTEQCRHNDGSGMNNEDVGDGGSTSQSATITVENEEFGGGGDGENETHIVDITVGDEDDGSTLNEIVVNYQNDQADVSNVGGGDLSLSLNGNDITGDIDSGNVSVNDNGTTLNVPVGGNNTLSAGDTITLETNNEVQDSNTDGGTALISVNGGTTSSASF